MADDQQASQEEIDSLLRDAQQASRAEQGEPAAEGASAEPAEPALATAGGALDQSEIEALMNDGAAPATATAASTTTAQPASGDGKTSQSDIELLLNKAEQAIASIDESATELPPGVAAFNLEDFSGTPPNREAATLELVRDVQLDLKIELGRTRMHLEDVLRLRQGSVVPLDKLAGDPVDVYVNGRLVARGEVLVLNDNFCVRVTELVAGEEAVA